MTELAVMPLGVESFDSLKDLGWWKAVGLGARGNSIYRPALRWVAFALVLGFGLLGFLKGWAGGVHAL